MSRKGSHPARVVLPDPKHGSQLIARFINMVMKSGKKSVVSVVLRTRCRSKSVRAVVWRVPCAG